MKRTYRVVKNVRGWDKAKVWSVVEATTTKHKTQKSKTIADLPSRWMARVLVRALRDRPTGHRGKAVLLKYASGQYSDHPTEERTVTISRGEYKEVVRLLKIQRYINAIKHLWSVTRLDLKEAKDAVDRIREGMRK